MSPGGVWAGKPIYVSRNEYFSFTLLGISAFMILKHVVALDTLHTIICIIVSYFWYDLYSGILHVVLDEPANISLPLIGQPCLEFQWHHCIPSDIAREHFLDVAGDLNIAVSIMASLHIVWSSSWTSHPYCSMFGGLKLFMAWFGQYSHRSAHSPRPKSLSPITKALQSRTHDYDQSSQSTPQSPLRRRLLLARGYGTVHYNYAKVRQEQLHLDSNIFIRISI